VEFNTKAQCGKVATKLFGARRGAKRHAAFSALVGAPKRCRRCAPVFAALRLGKLPPHSKILAAHDDFDLLHCEGTKHLRALRHFELGNQAECVTFIL
jgi:hypothetical protein